jgi:putative nucleotidyltransferase with HDIG domain
MFASLLSLFGGWWIRFFSRTAVAEARPTTPAETRGEPQASETPRGAPEHPGVGMASSAREPEPRAEPEDAAQTLIETLRLDALPVAPVRARVADPQVRERTLAALGNLQQIPALQSLAQGFTQVLSRPDVAVEEIVAAVAKDSALCVRVLRMANSVLVSPERRIEDLETAVQMLGVKRVRQAAQAMFTLRDAKRVAEGFDWRHLWIHALATAAIAEQLEPQLRVVADSQVHLAALLHDVGKIVLSTIAPDEYRDILVTAWHENGRLEDLEQQRLGVIHREAGVLFARHSGLPEMVVEVIAHHDRPETAAKYRFEVALVSVANYVSKAHGLGFSGARLDAEDGEFEDLPAWQVLAEECGARPDVESIAVELATFVTELRADLRELRELGA